MDIRELVMSGTLQFVREIRKSMERIQAIDRVTFAIE
jgi:hypothetical protein